VLHLLRGARGRARSSPPPPSCSCRRDGLRAGTLALAARRAAAPIPAVDDHLGEQLLRSDKDREEQAIVTRRIVPGPAPGERLGDGGRGARRGADGQHPAPGHADPRAARAAGQRGRARRDAASDARRSAGEPFAAAEPLIPALEGLDRGWYAGARWGGRTPTRTASSASRCAARCSTGAVARCYAGVGVVRDSDPAAELAETEVKLQALLPVLAG
jgi:salicylate biosynthesis isochorismate synthase/menaquinone-specific isochorismate synthase